MNTGIALKNFRKVWLGKVNFIMHWLIVQLVKAFRMNTMKDYHDLYLKVDVLFMGCVFETFRKESINSFGLNPILYLSNSGYIWNVILRLTDINLKLISDIEKYQFIDCLLMGGVSMICKGYPEDNDKFLKSYDANKPTLS